MQSPICSINCFILLHETEQPGYNKIIKLSNNLLASGSLTQESRTFHITQILLTRFYIIYFLFFILSFEQIYFIFRINIVVKRKEASTIHFIGLKELKYNHCVHEYKLILEYIQKVSFQKQIYIFFHDNVLSPSISTFFLFAQ